jgi:hypothetical protein
MRKRILISLLFIVTAITSLYSQSNELSLEGIFQGKNLYIMNPFSSSGVGFCVYEVTVNGDITTDEINSSAFEIDLSVFQYQLGDKLSIKIKHKEGCAPKVLNSEVLKPKSTFETLSINVSENGTLMWKTKGEAGKLDFDVQQYKWNKWVKVGTVRGKGTPGKNSYSYKVLAVTGKNKFRVKQSDYTKKPRYSTEATYKNEREAVIFTPKKPSSEIVFTAETMYEIYDFYGNIVLKGTGLKVDVSQLKKGDYFLNYDNEMKEFKKK